MSEQDPRCQPDISRKKIENLHDVLDAQTIRLLLEIWDEREALQQDVLEIAVCEQEFLVLKPGRLYKLHVMPGCERCRVLAEGMS